MYYPNASEWDNSDGGQLVLWPRDGGGGGKAGRRRQILPAGDRMVAFFSDEVEHEVLPVDASARAERLALSFWFLKPMAH